MANVVAPIQIDACIVCGEPVLTPVGFARYLSNSPSAGTTYHHPSSKEAQRAHLDVWMQLGTDPDFRKPRTWRFAWP